MQYHPSHRTAQTVETRLPVGYQEVAHQSDVVITTPRPPPPPSKGASLPSPSSMPSPSSQASSRGQDERCLPDGPRVTALSPPSPGRRPQLDPVATRQGQIGHQSGQAERRLGASHRTPWRASGPTTTRTESSLSASNSRISGGSQTRPQQVVDPPVVVTGGVLPEVHEVDALSLVVGGVPPAVGGPHASPGTSGRSGRSSPAGRL